MDPTSSSSIKALQEKLGTFYSLYTLSTAPEQHALFVQLALVYFEKHKSKKSRDVTFEISSALILGDALIALKNSTDPDAYKRFIQEHRITSTNASIWTRLAKQKPLLSTLGLSDKSLSAIVKLISQTDSHESAETDRLAALLAPKPEPLVSTPATTIRERSQVSVDRDQDVEDRIEALRGRARNGYLP